MRHAAGYAVAFAGAIWRELSDVTAGLQDGGSFNAVFFALLLVEVACLVVCVRATLSARSSAAA